MTFVSYLGNVAIFATAVTPMYCCLGKNYQPDYKNNKRHCNEMKHQDLFRPLAVSLLLGWGVEAMAESVVTTEARYDVTEAVLRNADFSSDFTSDASNRWIFVTPGNRKYQSGKWNNVNEVELLNGFAESWIKVGSVLNGFCLAQTTPKMPKGTYTVSFNYNGAVNNVNGGELMTNMVGFANTTTSVLDTSYAAPEAGTCTFEYENTTDASITVGVKTTGATNANWIAVDNFKIVYHGSQADYEEACAGMGVMMKKDYTHYIRNASCAYNEYPYRSWQRNGSAGGYAETPAAITPDGSVVGISYWNNSAQTNINLIYQTVNDLPAGKYRLTGKAAATVWNNNSGNDNRSGVYFFAGDTQTEVTTAQYGDYTVDFSVEKDSDAVTLGLKAGDNNGNTWCFLSSLTLLRFSDVTLSETDTEAPEEDSLVSSVTVERTLKGDKWNTLCLPFSMEKPSGWQVKALTGEGENTGSLVFTDASTIEAGMAYIVKPAADVSEIKAENVTISPETIASTTDNYTMTGNFVQQYVPLDAYFISGNKFYLADKADAVTLKGYRAYITAKGQTVASLPRTLVIDGIETSIGEVEGLDSQTDNRYYTLSGVMVKQPKKGIYICNKRIVIIK